MALQDLLKDVQILAVVCNQYGDTGKGKFSDFFASQWADIIARGTGGNNAGHTVVINGKNRVFHLLPAGISYDQYGKTNILGNGMVIDPIVLVEEMNALREEGISFNNLMISRDAQVIMPYHIAQDLEKDRSQKGGGIGSTGKGVGPAYTDKIARRGIMMRDLLDRDVLVRKIERTKRICPEQQIDIDKIVADFSGPIDMLKFYIRDTVSFMHIAIGKGKRVCLEGAQGLLLSIEHGASPYVTSSDCSINGTASGVGISAGAIDLSLGVIKFPFMTRVGGGPFPTELGGTLSEDYCSQDEGNRKNDETLRYSDGIKNLLNSPDDFIRGVGIRLAAEEYGATTSRPRRVGWTDAVAARYAVGVNGPMQLILTKVDSLEGLSEFKLCFDYKIDGRSSGFKNDADYLRRVVPEYQAYQGHGNIRGEKDFGRLPSSLSRAISDFERFVGADVAIVSTGPEMKETIVR